ncbi:hypothetical protein [Bradyrhizobium sp.]|uniref:hypothetical protein n=1 Tax=Bradyrhizobium sp. TaxID=376 RepID=UPI00260D7418|nr:hypothetical protein [Bradyrhizobium sp.]
MTAPLKRIIYSTEPTMGSRTRQGIMVTSCLECGHVLSTNAGERRRGETYCFDCFYGKPVTELGQIILDEHGSEDALFEKNGG